jgi:nucleoside-diphosphate-sugar epimerase
MNSSPGNTRLALILGATGGVGGAVAEALVAHGWKVRGLVRARRSPLNGPGPLGAALEWVKGDAMNAADVRGAAAGAQIIFHGLNPPRYQNWRGLAIPMLANTIAAARLTGARIIFPGNVYNFGPDAWPIVDESSPQNPTTRKGAVRVEMEAMLRSAAQGGVRSLVVRAGDFFGPQTRDSWFSSVILKGGAQAKAIVYPGEPKAGHAWAYLPDLAETFARLADGEQGLKPFEVFHFGGHWIEPGIAFAEALRRAIGRPDAPIRRFPWFALYLGAPFSGLFRELLEMRYLWRQPLRLDNARLTQRLGAEPHTPLDDALRATIFGADKTRPAVRSNC